MSDLFELFLLQNNLDTMTHLKFIFQTKKGQIVVDPDDIMYCLADGSYTSIVLSNHKKLIVSKRISEVEQQLDGAHFVRIHRSHLVNLQHAAQYVNHASNVLIMSNGEELKVAEEKKKDVLKSFIRL
jgi:two-component system LytT family response regulator